MNWKTSGEQVLWKKLLEFVCSQYQEIRLEAVNILSELFASKKITITDKMQYFKNVDESVNCRKFKINLILLFH